ncbi:MAG: N-acetylmuramoyl-L-alanine amidase [Burkholderiales bacterium]|nr:N-acetylmuramoyl-L-alanine amidase [Burkholderiales bacterium]
MPDLLFPCPALLRYPLRTLLHVLKGIATALVLSAPTFAADALVTSTRVWPAPDYTRVTIESQQPVRHKLFSLDNPDRLVLDLEEVALSATLNDIAGKISVEDPYIRGVRVGRFKPGTVRLVFDLKTRVKPEAFALAPIGEYGHRLVLDVYPLEPPDPLLAFLKRRETQPAEAPPVPAPEDAPPPLIAKGELPATPKPAPRTARPPSERLITIAIDAGHGGEDPGARGRRGTLEKHVTLAIAQKLKERIDNEHNMRAVLIRDGDYFIPLHMRVAKARRVRADLFVSIHADAFVKPSANGSSVFALSESGATSAAARWLAKQENDADLIGGVNLGIQDPYLKQTLLDLSQTASINDSLKLGRAVLAEMGGINRLHKNYVEQAGFAVLKAPDIPSILIETAFISNPDEEKKLKNPAYQNKMADAIFTGIKRYFSKNPPLAPAQVAITP